MEVYGFIGTPAYDFVLYLGEFLVEAGKSVLIFDYTENSELMSCMPQMTQEPVHFEGVDIVKETFLTSEGRTDYDVGLVLMSYSHMYQEAIFHNNSFSCIKELMVISDFRKHHVLAAERVLKNVPDTNIILLRDGMNSKINQSYIESNYFTEMALSAVCYALPFHENDYERRIRMEYEPVRSIRGLSAEFRSFLIMMAARIMEQPDKVIRKMYENWERRKKY